MQIYTHSNSFETLCHLTPVHKMHRQKKKKKKRKKKNRKEMTLILINLIWSKSRNFGHSVTNNGLLALQGTQ